MATSRRTRLRPEERRDQLVALGVATLANRPLSEVTVEEIAAEAEVSTGLVYYYFGSKNGLHHEIVLRARDSMLHASEPRPELPPLDRLHNTLERLVNYVREHGPTFYSLVRGAASGDEEVRELIESARREQTERAVAAVTEMGVEDTPMLRMALRSWVALAEQALVDGGLNADVPGPELVAYLESSMFGVVSATGAQLDAGPLAKA
ncbi:TetR/AcrR family transcriptional regulator [Myceligenerans indicum]|uniref:TetR family transcriptional regulator n=1 Tax=Myceligenerans indicum TaxID=2593663 RepID=A0ABS1LMI7_9MICO|nr:TetR/AcrR family transcriptional regulator [Myceligenerans indicum]MBL0887466.1 TetR family transcriptional regulator [Myceligenerans indicum]